MMKTIQDNDVSDLIGVAYVENETVFSWPIGPSAVYNKN